MMTDISTKQYLKELDLLVFKLGGPTKAAKHFDVSPQFLRAARRGQGLPGDKILAKMNLESDRTISYRYIRVRVKEGVK